MKIECYRKLFILFLIGISTLQLFSQTIFLDVKKWDGSEKSVELSTLKKVTFSGTDMILNYQSGNTENVATSAIRRLMFNFYSDVNDIVVAKNNSLELFPNPAVDYISLKNNQNEALNISVFSISGNQIMSLHVANSSSKIDVHSLSKGIYFVKTKYKVLKFIKL